MGGLAKDLMQVGIADQAAQRLGFVLGTATSAGTTNADATQLLKDATLVSVSSGGASEGVKLPSDAELGVEYVLANISANALLIYPGTGISINGDTATTGTVPLTARGTTRCIRTGATTWVATVGAAG